MPVNHPEESIHHSEHGKSLKSRMALFEKTDRQREGEGGGHNSEWANGTIEGNGVRKSDGVARGFKTTLSLCLHTHTHTHTHITKFEINGFCGK
jgi:hypothetical protein